MILSLIRCFHGITVDSFQVESYFDVENFRGNLGINNRISFYTNLLTLIFLIFFCKVIIIIIIITIINVFHF